MGATIKLPECEHCGYRDTAQVGDYSSMVASCSECQVMTCGDCWDKYHSVTCSGDYFDGPDNDLVY